MRSMRVVVPVLSPFGPGCGRPAASAAGARAVIRHYLALWDVQSVADEVLLVVTELLSNAVRHGTPPWSVRMWLVSEEDGRRYVRLEAADAGAGIDVEQLRAHWRRPCGSLLSGGRGLFIVDTLASRWGDDRSGFGHMVWAELDVKPVGPSHSAAGG
ncbi:ATP-binding protein [Streptomyces chryseus]|uniref:ATP-binding protein n=1 Tax=Streptomyces chryseus TaxID=68186 RepID=UPI00110FC7D2|nr:ATP-binding protein [Streptomyces chryseus]